MKQIKKLFSFFYSFKIHVTTGLLLNCRGDANSEAHEARASPTTPKTGQGVVAVGPVVALRSDGWRTSESG